MIPRHLAVSSFVILIGVSLMALAAPSLDSIGGLEPLDDRTLHGASGADPHKFFNGSINCDQNQAALANTISGGDSVAAMNCVTAHEAVACWSCNPPEGDMELLVFTNPGLNQPPGLKVGQSLTCGPASIGTCAMVSAAWVCQGIHATNATCFDITEYWSQGY